MEVCSKSRRDEEYEGAEGRACRLFLFVLSQRGVNYFASVPQVWGFEDGRICIPGPWERGEEPGSGSSSVVLGEGSSGTLRGALRAASATHFPPTGLVPDELLFTAPQYNLWIECNYFPTQEKVSRCRARNDKSSLPSFVPLFPLVQRLCLFHSLSLFSSLYPLLPHSSPRPPFETSNFPLSSPASLSLSSLLTQCSCSL